MTVVTAENATENVNINSEQFGIMKILRLLIASVGIFGFMNHRKLRHKILNRFNNNPVSHFYVSEICTIVIS